MQYIAFISLATFLPLFRRVNHLFIPVFSLVFICFAFATKEGSWDYFGYLDYFLCSIDSKCEAAGFEKSFSIISLVASKLFGQYAFDAVVLFYIFASIILKLTLFKKHSAWFGVSLFAYSCHGFFMGEMTQLRVSLAIALSWYAFSKYCAGKKVCAVVMLGLAVAFHLSSLVGVVVPLLRRVNPKIMAKLVFLAAISGYFLGKIEWVALPKVGFERVDVYLSAIGSDVLIASQLNFYVFVMFSTALLALWQKVHEFALFDRLCINSVLFGLCIYLLFYFIPIIPLRVLEFYASLYPFVAAIAYKSNRNNAIRIFIVAIYILLFANTMIRNNARLDLVFDWQTIPYENMTEKQIEQLSGFGY
ncbi:MAG: hypothetical protein BGN93_03140 [Acinetobacter sp. 39-4]|nr:MAG: hypothetical protein BGN93_03140 [Acinetobacter sp. 39-4]